MTQSNPKTEVVLLQWATTTDRLVISRLEFDFRCINPNGMNLVWDPPPHGELIGLAKHEFVIRNDNGAIKVIRRERTDGYYGYG